MNRQPMNVPVRRAVLPGPRFDLAPGQDIATETEPLMAPFRAERMIISQTYDRPELKYHHRGSGGSKRKGKLAAQRWAAECLAAKPHQGMLTVIDVHVGEQTEFPSERLCDLSAEMFSPEISPTLAMGTASPAVTIGVKLVNAEKARRVTGAISFLGLALPK